MTRRWPAGLISNRPGACKILRPVRVIFPVCRLLVPAGSPAVRILWNPPLVSGKYSNFLPGTGFSRMMQIFYLSGSFAMAGPGATGAGSDQHRPGAARILCRTGHFDDSAWAFFAGLRLLIGWILDLFWPGEPGFLAGFFVVILSMPASPYGCKPATRLRSTQLSK